MKTKLTWDETKRRSNLAKHGLDFADAAEVLDSRYRMDVEVIRQGEPRTASFSYVLGFLAVLTVVNVKKHGQRSIYPRAKRANFPPASGRGPGVGGVTKADVFSSSAGGSREP